jgi:hypothetical protein
VEAFFFFFFFLMVSLCLLFCGIYAVFIFFEIVGYMHYAYIYVFHPVL